jgi:hypothetical protein
MIFGCNGDDIIGGEQVVAAFAKQVVSNSEVMDLAGLEPAEAVIGD